MSPSTIRTVNSIGTANASPPSNGLGITAQQGQAQFLQLLSAQLQNQDPLNPITNSDFTAQLAQFSTLQGIQTLNSNFSEFFQLQELTQSANLIGRHITYQSGQGAGAGVVSGVNMNNGAIQLQVGTANVALNEVTGVTQ